MEVTTILLNSILYNLNVYKSLSQRHLLTSQIFFFYGSSIFSINNVSFHGPNTCKINSCNIISQGLPGSPQRNLESYFDCKFIFFISVTLTIRKSHSHPTWCSSISKRLFYTILSETINFVNCFTFQFT